MLADRIEAKWIDAFCEIFERCAVKSGDTAAIFPRPSRARSMFISPSWRCCGWVQGRFT